MMLGILERKSLHVLVTQKRSPQVSTYHEVPQVTSGELEDEFYFKDGRFCNDLSSLQPRQSFLAIRELNHPNFCGDPWCSKHE